MSTTPIRLPCCGSIVRVAVQESIVEVMPDRVLVKFDQQNVAHACPRPVPPKDARTRAHSLKDCWCGMPHRREDFL